MDKRWIAIIIILIAGLSAMTYIVLTSNTVGNAVTVVDDITISLPPGFKILGTHTGEATLVSEGGSNETVYIKYLNDGNTSSKAFKKRVTSIENNVEFEITKKSNNTMQVRNITSNNNMTLKYFEKYDRTLYMKLTGFDNENEANKIINFIVDNAKPDYKQDRS